MDGFSPCVIGKINLYCGAIYRVEHVLIHNEFAYSTQCIGGGKLNPF